MVRGRAADAGGRRHSSVKPRQMRWRHPFSSTIVLSRYAADHAERRNVPHLHDGRQDAGVYGSSRSADGDRRGRRPQLRNMRADGRVPFIKELKRYP